MAPGQKSISQLLASYAPDIGKYEELYKHLHLHPELSWCEKETAALMCKKLKELSTDLHIKTGIGGHGLFAVFKNGPGKTVLLRADIDALPVLEKTDFPYKSEKTMPDVKGAIKPVMHACGHDFHMTSGLAAAEILIKAREHWSGTCIFLFQVAEETVSGAKAMVKDGLYDPQKHACPIPDMLIGQHVLPLPAGMVGIRPGPIMSASDSFRVVVHGQGGHGSMPHNTVDPVVIASHITVRLQTIVSRQVPPDQTAVLTVGAIQAGQAPNIIPDEVEMKINMRTYDTKIREKMIESLHRIINAECEASNAPKPPEIEHIETTPRLDNDPELEGVIEKAFGEHFGERFIPNVPRCPASEDFGVLAEAVDKPYCYWFFGGYPIDHKGKSREGIAEEASKKPVNHSPFFAPVLQPTLKTGIDAMAVSALAALS